MVDYSERLTQIMKAREVSTKQLAAAIGLSYQAVKKVVDGKSHGFSALNHELACKYLGINGFWLATGKPIETYSTGAPSQAHGAAEPPPAATWERECVDLLKPLSDEDRRAALLTLKTFVAMLPKQNNGQGLPMAA